MAPEIEHAHFCSDKGLHHAPSKESDAMDSHRPSSSLHHAPSKGSHAVESNAGDKEPLSLGSLPEHYVPLAHCGSGAYGEVFLCKDQRTNENVAIKRIRDFTRDMVFGQRVLREIRLMAHLRHENLLRLIDMPPVPSPDFDDVYFVMPHMESDLHRVIHSKTELTEPHIQAFVCQILRGLKYLHSTGVCHRDLKPSNILVNSSCKLKICDFGLARGRLADEDHLTGYVVTRWYRAPEVMLVPKEYGDAVDLWSLGCILCELYGRKPLFPGADHVDMLVRIAEVLGFRPEEHDWLPLDCEGRNFLTALRLPPEGEDLALRYPQASPAGINLAQALLTWNPAERLSAADAIQHPFVGHLRDAKAECPASQKFSWDFDRFEPTKRELKDRMYAECVRMHPEIVRRDATWLMEHGFMPQAMAASAQAEGPSPSTVTRPNPRIQNPPLGERCCARSARTNPMTRLPRVEELHCPEGAQLGAVKASTQQGKEIFAI